MQNSSVRLEINPGKKKKGDDLRLRNCSLILTMLTQMFTNGQSCEGKERHSLGEGTAAGARPFPAIG